MKSKSIILSLLFSAVLFSCSDKKDESVSEEILTETDSLDYAEEPETENSALADLQSNATFKNWRKHYQSTDPSFSMNNFNLEQTQKLEMQPGSVKGNFEAEFDKTYEPFLIYNPSRTFYLDIDSYNWSKDEEGNALFEADQAVNMVDVKKKTVQQVAFFGPSYWVEDAFWVSDSIFILLQNNDENVPEISTYNLKDNSVFLFQNDAPIQKSDSSYTKMRLAKKGVKMMP
ncbi:hypothetical protein [Moheibacter lacus]|uniref:Lipoprotein n=1 Tax=Moheibacter lacus TaxID=2745851 RepID=A0A838ZPI5_9FLAO|nr:hypothetical protein [Moheibacter lacus]MBA5628745.1 hypothetical protein [Moheibacter lacus]